MYELKQVVDFGPFSTKRYIIDEQVFFASFLYSSFLPGGPLQEDPEGEQGCQVCWDVLQLWDLPHVGEADPCRQRWSKFILLQYCGVRAGAGGAIYKLSHGVRGVMTNYGSGSLLFLYFIKELKKFYSKKVMVAWLASIHVRTSKYYSQRRWFSRFLIKLSVIKRHSKADKKDIQRPVRWGSDADQDVYSGSEFFHPGSWV